MVEFKDDGTATTPGKPWENRDAESAVVADLVAVELDDAGLNLNTKRLPILARIYGAVVLLDGLATLPIMVISILYAVREILDGHVHVDAMSLTFILSAIHAVVLVGAVPRSSAAAGSAFCARKHSSLQISRIIPFSP